MSIRFRPAHPVVPVLLLAAFAAGCGTYRLEPLPPEDRGPQARVPGLPPGADPGTTPNGGSPADPGSPGSVIMLLDPVDCPVCAEMLAGRLRGVPGVSAVTVDHSAGRVVLSPRPNAAVSVPAVRLQTESANFVVRSIEMRP